MQPQATDEILSCFLVCARTGENCNGTDYPMKSEQLQNLLEIAITQNMKLLTKDVPFTKCDLHVEVTMDYDKQSLELPSAWDPSDTLWELCGRAVLEFSAPTKVTLDKPKLTKLLRSHTLNPWGDALKVEKRALPCDWQTPASLPMPDCT